MMLPALSVYRRHGFPRAAFNFLMEVCTMDAVSTKKSSRKKKDVIIVPNEFVAIDTETTGLSATRNEIIEVSAVRYRYGHAVGAYETLIKPSTPVNPFVSILTGITNKKLKDAPSADDVIFPLLNFIGSSVLVGHNIGFDLQFLNCLAERNGVPPLSNDSIDTLHVARQAFPGMKSHKLSDLAAAFDLPGDGFHRAGYDSRMSAEVLLYIARGGEIVKTVESEKRPKAFFREYVKVSELKPECDEIDVNSPCYGKVFVFTGELSRYGRRQAMQEVVNRGGRCKTSVTRDTDYLVEGSFEGIDVGDDGESTKQQMARKYRHEGYDIHVIPESMFLDMLE